MKKLLALLFCSCVCTALMATPIAFEPFDYSLTPTNLVGHSNLDGFTWSLAGPSTPGTNVPFIASGNLSYAGLAPSYGNSVQFGGIDGTGNGMAARFSLPSLVKTNSLYYSFIMKVTDITALDTTATGIFWAGFNNTAGALGTSPTVVFSRVYTKTNATGGYQIGIAKNPAVAADVAYDPNPHNVGDVLYIVASYDFVDGLGGTMDTSRMWINPSASFFSGTEPTPSLSTSAGNNPTVANGGLQSFCLFNRRAGEPHGIIVDQLVIGTTWADVTPTNVPLAITSQPRDQRVVAGGSASFTVSTFNGGVFQWQHNNVDISTGTQRTLTLNSVQAGDAGSYHVKVSNTGAGPIVSSNAVLTVFPDIYPRLVPLWSIAPFSRPYMTTDGTNVPNQRFFAYNALSNQVLVVSRTNTVTGLTNPAVYVIQGDTGADLYQMQTNGITGGANGGALSLNCIDVSDDGSVYAANVSDSSANFSLYYWTNSDPATPPQLILNGDPSGGMISGGRFGDSMAVRGGGPNTQIVVVDSTGRFGSILSPQVGQPLNVANWNNAPFTNASGGTVGGRTLLFFGTTNTVWEKYGGSPLELITYDTGFGVQTSSIITNIPNLVNSPALVAFNAATNILCAIDLGGGAGPDTVDQYDLSDPTQPLFVRKYDFPVNHQGNGNGTGRMLINGDRVYALDSNNGMAAFRIEPVLSITYSGGNVIVAWSASTPGYTLKSTSSLLPPVTWNTVGTGTLVGQQYFVTNTTPTGTLFYRLQKP